MNKNQLTNKIYSDCLFFFEKVFIRSNSLERIDKLKDKILFIKSSFIFNDFNIFNLFQNLHQYYPLNLTILKSDLLNLKTNQNYLNKNLDFLINIFI